MLNFITHMAWDICLIDCLIRCLQLLANLLDPLSKEHVVGPLLLTFALFMQGFYV